MSFGVSSRSTSRQHALRNSTVVSPVAMAGLPVGASGTWISSRLRSSRTTGISSLSIKQRYGTSSLASITRLTTGKSIDVSRNRAAS